MPENIKPLTRPGDPRSAMVFSSTSPIVKTYNQISLDLEKSFLEINILRSQEMSKLYKRGHGDFSYYDREVAFYKDRLAQLKLVILDD